MRTALLLLLIACGGDPELVAPEPTPVVVKQAGPPTCEVTIHTAAQRIIIESKRVELASTLDRTASLMIASCEVEAWPTNVLACIASARLDADLEACTEELTYRQHKRLHDKIAQILPPPARPVIVARPRPPSRSILIPRLPSPPPPALLPPPPPPATAKVDCSQTLIAPTNAACQKQYCLTHATQPRCMIE